MTDLYEYYQPFFRALINTPSPYQLIKLSESSRYIRCRVASVEAEIANPTEPAVNGEVEDHIMPFAIHPIPTLSEWALMMLMMLLGFIGYQQGLIRLKK